jgi:cysteine dioxygenase
MTQTLELCPPPSRVSDFIAGLKSLETEPITSARVTGFLAEERPSAEAFAPYLFWDSSHYARNLIYRDPFFEVLALCWLPGQRTPIHSHNGQLGWVTILQGELVCRNYRFVRSADSGTRVLARRSQTTSARRVEVELLAQANCQADGSVSTVDRRQTTHQLENVEKSCFGTVSLHVYSRPIDCCVLFDEAHRCCERRHLQYHSVDGVILEKSA